MPIYEYTCPGCKHKFELMRRVSQCSEPVTCPKCHKPAERKLSTFACYSTGAAGLTQPVGGASSCSGCSSSSCSTCGM